MESRLYLLPMGEGVWVIVSELLYSYKHKLKRSVCDNPWHELGIMYDCQFTASWQNDSNKKKNLVNFSYLLIYSFLRPNTAIQQHPPSIDKFHCVWHWKTLSVMSKNVFHISVCSFKYGINHEYWLLASTFVWPILN